VAPPKRVHDCKRHLGVQAPPPLLALDAQCSRLLTERVDGRCLERTRKVIRGEAP
jgi:hypothetical protein